MFLQLQHQKLDVYQATRKFTLECYKITRAFPDEEKFNLISQIRRASVSVHLNLAEGASRKSAAERKRFFEISRSSIIEIDAAFDIASELNYLRGQNLDAMSELTNNCFSMLTKLINSTN